MFTSLVYWRNVLVNKVKVKCTLVLVLRLCTGRMAHRGSRGVALLFLDHSTRRGWGVSVTSRSLFTPGKDPLPIIQDAEWVPGLVWTGAENLAPTGIWSPDHPAYSQLLYWLRYLQSWWQTYFLRCRDFHEAWLWLQQQLMQFYAPGFQKFLESVGTDILVLWGIM